MRVFVTGSTGYIGSAIVKNLVQAGHQVVGLVRSPEKEAALKGLGGTPVRGDMKSLPPVVSDCDGVIHAAFEMSAKGSEVDRSVVSALLAAAKGRGKALVYTSGVLVLGATGDTPADEQSSTAKAFPPVAWRPGVEKVALEGATDSLATAVIRPGFVYGAANGLVGGYFATATKDGAAAYVGDGGNRMSFVHRDDLAQLYRLVLEQRARGVFHGVDGGAPRIRELAKAASEVAGKGGATKSIPVEAARQQSGPFAEALCLDQVVVSKRAGEVGWKLAHPALPGGLAETFQEWKAAATR